MFAERVLWEEERRWESKAAFSFKEHFLEQWTYLIRRKKILAQGMHVWHTVLGNAAETG